MEARPQKSHHQLKRLAIRYGISAKLGKRTFVAVISQISHIERGILNKSISTVYAIACALEMSLGVSWRCESLSPDESLVRRLCSAALPVRVTFLCPYLCEERAGSTVLRFPGDKAFFLKKSYLWKKLFYDSNNTNNAGFFIDR